MHEASLPTRRPNLNFEGLILEGRGGLSALLELRADGRLALNQKDSPFLE